MRNHADQWTIEEMAHVLAVSHSGYYRYCYEVVSQRAEANAVLLEAIRHIFIAHRQTYGSPRIHAELKAQGFVCSRARISRLMRQAGLKAKMRRFYKTTTRVNYRQVAAPNLLQQNFASVAPNEKWVADISYVRTLEGWLYVAVVLDLFSRKVVGLSMNESLQTTLVLQALEQALQRRKPTGSLQHHSDRGCQYTSQAFQELLKVNHIVCSMSGRGNCFDNAVAESFFHTLKTECIYFERYKNRAHATQSIFEYVEVFYNNQRRHSTLGYVSPAEFERRYYQQQLCS